MDKIILVIDDTAAAAVGAAEAKIAAGRPTPTLEQQAIEGDKLWPFLLRFPITAFDICLGVGIQAIMWKALASSNSASFIHGRLEISFIFWVLEVLSILIISLTYILKMIKYFEAVCQEYYHPIRVNFFFAPWISLLFLCLGLPPSMAKSLPHWLWYVLMVPILGLELKIYGQWMSRGERRLSKAGNPSNLLAVVGNFVGSWLGASMGIKEAPIFFFAVGMVHYIVVFVTLYQRLPTNENLKKELHPVFFLFVAAPSLAAIAWAEIEGSFGNGSRIAYFTALFLYLSLAIRVDFFRGFKFSLAWWAYTVPMTSAAVATITYYGAAPSTETRILTLVLCAAATLIVVAILLMTIVRAFVLRDLFPNDTDILIISNDKKLKSNWWHNSERISGNSEKHFKFIQSQITNKNSCNGVSNSAPRDAENPSP